jgi:ABC-2 type transport system permease protein
MTTVQPRTEVSSVLRPAAEHQHPASPVRASLVYAKRAMLKIRHVPEQLFDVTVFPIMMTLMFTFLFGGALAGSIDAYVQYLIPGIFAQTIIMITMYTGLTLNKDIEKGIFDRFRSLPVWRPAPLVGALLGDQVRYLLAGAITMALGFALGFRPAGGLVSVLIATVLLLVFAFALSWMWTMIALLVRTEQAVMGISMFILMPLVFASNIFVDPATMPRWLQGFVEVNPVSVVVTAMRDVMSGTPVASDILLVFGWSAILVAGFGPITMVLYNRKT